MDKFEVEFSSLLSAALQQKRQVATKIIDTHPHDGLARSRAQNQSNPPDEERTVINSNGKRVSSYGNLLTVPGAYSHDKQYRCPRCTWTLLARPQGLPHLPIIAVTDPNGVTMYPHDHTYYHNDSDYEVDDDDSDSWG
ncbi:hypothetical protein F5Y04DRAFT_289779 [Hypomontagnella monticulosa]|nr:hypothetical protein F5Y04DRAFT_289779 [Hypomontagnella monticulosa]